jgi:sugar/nucleoside kinase (ribokinase family)
MPESFGRETMLTAVGNPLIDIYLPVTAQQVRDSGLEPGTVSHGPLPQSGPVGRLLAGLGNPPHAAGEGVQVFAAGGTFTAARLIGEAGLSAVYLGCVGRDDGGAEFFEAAAGRLKLELQNAPGNTGRCCYLYDPNIPDELTIAVDPGASGSFSPDCRTSELMRRSAWVCIEGFLLARTGSSLIAGALAPNAALDLASPFSAVECRKLLPGLAEAQQLVLFGTKEEFAAFFSLEAAGDGELEKHCRSLSSLTDTACIIKDGPRGVTSIRNGAVAHHPAPRIPSAVRRIVTIGAGDAFSSGYLIGRMRGEPEPACLARGTAYAQGALAAAGPPAGRPFYP